MANGRQKYVSDIIGEDYKNWNNEFIILDCDTGTGKTYFSIEVLGRYAQENDKKILYLCNRRELRLKVYRDIKIAKLLDVIKVTTYQKLQRDIQDHLEMPQYDYIITDECHYFTTDASFNDYTGDSYHYVMNQEQSVVLLTSATAKNFFNKLISDKVVSEEHYYILSKDYSYVDRVYFYQKNDLIGIINDILASRPEDKILVFCQSEDRMLEMYDVYGEEAQYFCSKSAKSEKLRRICGWLLPGTNKSKDVNQCIISHDKNLVTFEKRLLFTTIAMDNGVDIKDRNLKHIFTEIIDVDVMIQALGRKRSLDSSDTCTFYIKEYPQNGIQGLMNKAKHQLDPVKLYLENYDEFYEKYGDGKNRQQVQKNKIFYGDFKRDKGNSGIEVNNCRYQKYQQDYMALSAMKEMGYIEYLKSVLPSELVAVSEIMVSNVEEIDSFLEFLRPYEGKRLYKEDRKVILEKFKTSVAIKLSGKSVGIKTLNGQLDDLYADHYSYRFWNVGINGKAYVDKNRRLADGSPNPNRDRAYWVLEDRKSKLFLG